MDRWKFLALGLVMMLMLGTSMTWLYNQGPSVHSAWQEGNSAELKSLSPADRLLVKFVKDHDIPIAERLYELQKSKDEEEKKRAEEEKKQAEEQDKIKQKVEARHKLLEHQYNQMVERDNDRLLRTIETENNPEPAKSKIVIVTAANSQGQSSNITRFEQIQKNRKDYADYHGYKYQFVDTTQFEHLGGPPHWGKVPAVRKAFEDNKDAEWVWWLDADALIMNSEIDLAKHLLNPKVLEERITWGRPVRDPDYKFTRYLCNQTEVNVGDISILMSHDNMGWNAGSMFFKRSTATDMILSMWDIETWRNKEWRQNEQTVFTYLAFQSDEMFRRIGTIPQRLCNSYYNEQIVYEPGDLVLHFAGTVKKKDDFSEIWDKMLESVIRPPK